MPGSVRKPVALLCYSRFGKNETAETFPLKKYGMFVNNKKVLLRKPSKMAVKGCWEFAGCLAYSSPDFTSRIQIVVKQLVSTDEYRCY